MRICCSGRPESISFFPSTLQSVLIMSTSDSREESPASSPVNINHAPKYGTRVPNRVFVGGIAHDTKENELQALFSKYGNVKSAKIIADRAGISKGYGFVTFSCEAEAKRIQDEADDIYLKDRKLNIGPAIKKQPFSRSFEQSPPQTGLTYQNGMAFFTQTIDPNYNHCSTTQQGTAVQVVYPQHYFVPQQYAQPTPTMQPQPTAIAPSQWTRWPNQTYCSYPHQIVSYTHPNNVMPSNVGTVTPTSTTSSSCATICSSKASSQQTSPQIIPSPDGSTIGSITNGMQVLDCGYNQSAFHGIPCFQAANVTSTFNDNVHETQVSEHVQHGTPIRGDKDSISSLSQSPCSLSPSPRKPRSKTKDGHYPRLPRTLVAKTVNGVSVLAYPKPKIHNKHNSEPLTPPPTPSVTTATKVMLPKTIQPKPGSKKRHRSL